MRFLSGALYGGCRVARFRHSLKRRHLVYRGGWRPNSLGLSRLAGRRRISELPFCRVLEQGVAVMDDAPVLALEESLNTTSCGFGSLDADSIREEIALARSVANDDPPLRIVGQGAAAAESDAEAS